MIKYEKGKIVLEGSVPQLVSETALLLDKLHDALSEKIGEEETERRMKFIFENYRKTESQLDEMTSDIMKEIVDLLLGKEDNQ